MTISIHVDGMSCEHCANTIRRAVSALDGVQALEVDVAGGTVTVDGDCPVATIVAAITDAGYTPQGVVEAAPRISLPLVSSGGCCCG